MNKSHFFVTGLARSRTAWIANFLTYGSSYCHHDLMRLGTTAKFVRMMLEATDSATVGDSDSGLLAIAPAVVEEFPESRWVLIERPAEEAAVSYVNAFGVDPYPGCRVLDLDQAREMMEVCLRWCDRVKKTVPEHLLMVLKFSDLEDERGSRALWEWCNPGQSFNYVRYNMLNTFSVNIIGRKVKIMDDAAARWSEVMA